MASLSFTQPLTITYTSNTVIATPSLFPNIKNRKKVSIVRVSCKGSESDKESSNPSLDRRNVLIGLGGLYGTVSGTVETTTAVSSFPLVLDKTITVLVARPKKSRSKKEKEDAEEVLLVDGIEFPTSLAVKFDVYLDDEDQDASSGPDKVEFAGSFVNVPHNTKGSAEKQKKKTCLKLGISDLLDDVGAEDDDNVLVTLVPRSEIGKVTVGGIKIVFLS
ncbi:hypothetical protein UlMin_018475 [Ulmus minor]